MIWFILGGLVGISIMCLLQINREDIIVDEYVDKYAEQQYLINKKDRQLIEKTNRIKKLEKECQNYFDNMMNTISSNKRKDKNIDKMARFISMIMTDNPIIKEQLHKKYCEFINSDEDCCWKTDKKCKDCIKEYFERKVK